jgi:hypothetical protein
LDLVIVDCAISDPIGRQFWKQYFLKKEEVAWTEFVDAFEEFLGYKVRNPNKITFTYTAKANKDKDKHTLHMRCLHALLGMLAGIVTLALEWHFRAPG